ncbi:7-cyano-7-deazaguanine synthase QueC [Sporosarcina sp. P21c]|uniref:7-cyano-7-deazaguanine synthase QueC n=1 Tax=unclassified Sporosarcina TaxID=2647733 RepID=UPI000A164DB7|nr:MULTISPECIES: 7-cyano-7-deazaguanine synthase QueC [Sporosarcina]ARJ37442.1 7-cyano-7-deazaguanine synthase QueC [Sporosarcina ureae]PIC66932.1 7-cyano-7-deazaguanine synthase QueC [Sporosarcina sp. P16a]PIC89433.1 7-cyano-7-deazaguanine synthase QueC [Sporosarcina sp. P21c]PIC92384.1 7-cyano-7-deazaguanine synthase QueC [Sporosarcina sp. P25]
MEECRVSKAVVVFSGGQDSTTCLLWAMEEFDEVETVTFLYGQRHKLEVDCATKIAKDLGVKQKIIQMDVLNQLTSNALTRDGMQIEVEEGSVPNTFVEGRNHIFLSFAAIYAKTVGAKAIITGVSETDFSGYPDCRDEFIRSLNTTLNLAMDYPFDLITPLMWKDKAEVWAMADQMGRLKYIRENTLTCYNGVIADGCKECPACQLRNDGLAKYLQGQHVS